MKRNQMVIAVLAIEIMLGLMLAYAFGYVTLRNQGRLPPLQSNAPAPQPQASSTQVAIVATTTQVALIPDLSPALLSLFMQLPPEAAPGNYQITDELINLGRMLYYEPRLSVSQKMSCNTCHPLERYGTDGMSTSLSHDGKPGKRNAQTVYNSAFHIAQFWDGRSPTVEDQAKGPILANAEMGMATPEYVMEVLRSIPGYAPVFATAFPGDPDPIKLEHVGQAIGAFERKLTTPSRFDRFMAGDYAQLTPEEQHGLLTFINVGCVTCHMGATVGGLLYKKLGEMTPYTTTDLGRFTVTGVEDDRYVFKVQSLRNIAMTAPYLHDGSIQTLPEMVKIMGRHQLGKELSDAQIAEIILFLNTLTGDIPADYIAPPQLPASGPNTPLPYQGS